MLTNNAAITHPIIAKGNTLRKDTIPRMINTKKIIYSLQEKRNNNEFKNL